ncbi:MAG: XRE family transcriptional regulator [Oscillospiraceae bacterium]|nr:XRE family transcriptional regulator [Oscillospiraceae bacterium]
MTDIKGIAQRIKGMREIAELSAEETAAAAGVTTEEYLEYESGEKDFSFTFLNNLAEKLNVDLIELITGENPHLSGYSIVRKNQGLSINRRAGFNYEHLGYRFQNKLAECFKVTAPFRPEEQDAEIALSSHPGQEFDYILKGRLKFKIEGHIEFLSEGDSVFYDSSKPHGMVAYEQDCEFLAVTIHSTKK